MHPALILAIEIPFTLIALTLIARIYVVPRLATLPIGDALIPLLLIHLVRPISLWTLAPTEMTGATIPAAWAWSTAIGDVIAAALALVAIVLLRAQSRAGVVMAWVFNVVGFLDAVKNGIYAAKLEVLPHMGQGALILAYVVPLLYVSHALIFWRLLKR